MEFVPKEARTAFFGQDPLSIAPWWVVADMACVATFQVRHPISVLVLVKSYDRAFEQSLDGRALHRGHRLGNHFSLEACFRQDHVNNEARHEAINGGGLQISLDFRRKRHEVKGQ
jgi:hypothetical protein